MMSTIRPRQADVLASYDRGADSYETLWSPVILPPAAALVPSVVRTSDWVVVDVGAGTGALHGTLSAIAPTARLVALDLSANMLRMARTHRGATTVLADALALPLADSSADVVILAYVLFHLADPAQALAEAARILRPGGRVATITWAWERGPCAAAVWDQFLTDANVPPAPLRCVNAGLDRPSDVAALLRSAGLTTEQIRCERLSHQWDPPAFWKLANEAGTNGIRLGGVDAATRTDVLARMQAGLTRLAPRDFLWEGEVICAVATKEVARRPARCRPLPGRTGRSPAGQGTLRVAAMTSARDNRPLVAELPVDQPIARRDHRSMTAGHLA